LQVEWRPRKNTGEFASAFFFYAMPDVARRSALWRGTRLIFRKIGALVLFAGY